VNRQIAAQPGAKSEPPILGGLLQRKCACGQHTGGGECEECRKKKQTLQRKVGRGAEPVGVPPIVHEVLRSPGKPLDPGIRASMEHHFRQDFSRVRIHAGSHAAESATAVNALAYTVGANVVFGAGEYQPETSAGKGLLAHELAHVIQQGQGGVGGAMQINAPNDPAEQEAERAADAVSRNASPGRIAGAPDRGVLARKDKLKRGGAADAGAAPALCGGKWSCATKADCAVPDRAGTGAASNSWQLIVHIDIEAPTASDVRLETVGHSYVEFRESNGAVYTYGYYPTQAVDPGWLQHIEKPGCVVHPDTAHRSCVDYSETFNLTQPQYTAALKAAQDICSLPGAYHAFTNNCATFVGGIARAAGQTLPSPRGGLGPAGAFKADNPNTLIDALRARDAAKSR
jgi:Domain of unknown function (DUF4157)